MYQRYEMARAHQEELRREADKDRLARLASDSARPRRPRWPSAAALATLARGVAGGHRPALRLAGEQEAS